MPHTLENTLQEVVDSPDGYVAVHGVLTFDTALLPKVDWNAQQNTPPITKIPATLSGKSLTKNGFTSTFRRQITLAVNCLGPWCASAPNDKPVLAFLKQSRGQLSLSITPCGGHAFFSPKAKALKTVKRCFVSNTCPRPAH